MSAGKNLYSVGDVGSDGLPPGPLVFISHRRDDKPFARAVAEVLMALGVHVWLDENDEDLARAQALGEFGDLATIRGIERGVRHCSVMMGLLTRKTPGSWWVPYELGYCSAAGKPPCYLLANRDETPAPVLPEYVSNAGTYQSVDELARWAAMQTGHDLHAGLDDVPLEIFEPLPAFLSAEPEEVDLTQCCRRAREAIRQLGDARACEALRLTSQTFEWLPTAGGIIREIAYDLSAPLAWAQLQGHGSEVGTALLAPTLHHELAREAPALTYDPTSGAWKRERYRHPAAKWMQGLNPRQLRERLNRFVMARDRCGRSRLATKAEFKAEFDRVLERGDTDARRSLGVLVNPLLGFSPEQRPVYWRVLAVQYCVYSKFLGEETEDGPFGAPLLRLAEQFIRSRAGGR